ncbi:MAG TPA: hypothetical protein PLB01_05785 [Thermoanaerobaculia bacterium]|nr:hypothetical protein [Thermoanaerobaculia bacterium]
MTTPLPVPPEASSPFVLEHPAGVRVSRELSERDLAAFGPPEPDARHLWEWYSLPPFRDETVTLSIGLGYKAGRLEVISLQNVDPRFDGAKDGWEARERGRAESLRLWLTAKGLAPGRYSWGEISVVFDEKSGFGSAGVRFAL